MTTPLALLLAAFAVVPWLVHRMKRKPRITRALPTIALLQRTLADSERQRRFADVLLLAIRTSLLIGAAIAAAQWTRKIELPFAPGERTDLVLVLDDSLSMSARQGRRTRYAQAVARAEDLVRALGPSSSVTILLASAPSEVTLLRGTPPNALETLNTPHSALGGPGLRAAVTRASQLAARNAATRIIVLSDFAEHEALASLPHGTFLETFGSPEAVRDAAIVHVQTHRRDDALSLEVALQSSFAGQARVHARSDTGVERTADVALRQGEQRISIDGLDASARTVDVRLDVDDAIAVDDVYTAHVGKARREALVVAGDHASAMPFMRAVQALSGQLALAARSIDPLALNATTLDDATAVILPDGAELDSARAAAIDAWVQGGGTLVYAVGDGGDIRRASERLQLTLGAYATATIDREARVQTSTLSALQDTKLTRRAAFELVAGVEILARFDDESPALAVHARGAGKAYFMAFPLDDAWSDLALSARYVAVVADLIGAQAAPPAALHGRHRFGLEANALRVTSGATSFALPRSAHSNAFDLEPSAFGDYRLINVDDERTLTQFSVTPSSEELTRTQATSLAQSAASRAARTRTLRSVSLSPWTWLIVALLVFAEALLRERSTIKRVKSTVA